MSDPLTDEELAELERSALVILEAHPHAVIPGWIVRAVADIRRLRVVS